MQLIERNPIYARLVRNRNQPSLRACALIALLIAVYFSINVVTSESLALFVALSALIVFTAGPAFAGLRNAQTLVDFTASDAFELVRLTSLSDADFRRGVTFAALYRVRLQLAIAIGLVMPASLLYTNFIVLLPSGVSGPDAGCLLSGSAWTASYVIFFSLYFGLLSLWFALNLGAFAALKFRYGVLRSGLVLGVSFGVAVFLFSLLVSGDARLCLGTLLSDLLFLGFRVGVGVIVLLVSDALRHNIRLDVTPR